MNLYIVATPIGNLEDITFRALRVLKEADIILAEDKRVSKKLLDNYGVTTQMQVWHQHSTEKDFARLTEYFDISANVALVTDAGTPNLSDPGGKLIELVLARYPAAKVIPIPGASALSAIISVAGMAMDKFNFLGFLPHKKGRQTIIAEIKAADRPIIFFESVHRIIKTLAALADSPKKLVVGRELSKQFETIYRGTAKEILAVIRADLKQQKGEFTVIVSK